MSADQDPPAPAAAHGDGAPAQGPAREAGQQGPPGGERTLRPQDPRTRRRIRLAAIVGGALLLLAGAVWLASWLLVGRYHVTTDDAYVGGDQVPVNALVAGTVISIAVDDTDQVAAGQLLVELDPSDADLEVGLASATLGVAVRGVRQLQAEARRARAQALVAELAVRRTTGDRARRADAAQEGTVSQEEAAHAESAAAESVGSERAAQAAFAALSAQIDGTSLAHHPQVEEAAARLRIALLAQSRTRITAPCAGMVARRMVQIGQRIQPGQPLLALVALDRLWADANYKESQLRGVVAGQAATVHADLYGGSVIYHARVEGLEAGTGAAFALLPPQNATGNWIKIVQRLPVRLALDPDELARHPLRIGLSLRVDIGIGPQRSIPPGTPARGARPERPPRSALPSGLAAEAEEIITRIIEQQGSLPADVPLSATGPLAPLSATGPAAPEGGAAEAPPPASPANLPP